MTQTLHNTTPTAGIDPQALDQAFKASTPAYRTEMTPAGEQCVIPGCELNNFKLVRSQLDLF